MSALERDPQVPALTPHKVLGPGIDKRGILRGPELFAWGVAFSEAPRRPPSNWQRDWPFLRRPERVPEVPVISREHLQQLEKIQEVLPSRRDGAHFC